MTISPNVPIEKENKPKHTIVRMRGTRIALLLPDGYERQKREDLPEVLSNSFKNTDVMLTKVTKSSVNTVVIFKTCPEESMDPNDPQSVIDEKHEKLLKNESLTEEGTGETKRGYKYIYRITELPSFGQAGGALYFLRLDLFHKHDIVEVFASFSAKREGLDSYALSQTHDLLLAILNDELVLDQGGTQEGQAGENDDVSSVGVNERTFLRGLFVEECRRDTYPVEVEPRKGKKAPGKSACKDKDGDSESAEAQEEFESVGKSIPKKRDTLDERLRKVIDEYNTVYASLKEHGTQLFNQRERSLDLLENIEALINSIANRPKTFDGEISEIQEKKKQFRDDCDFAREECEAAKKSAMGVGVGLAGGLAVATLAPSAAMWVATTFGTASTGTAISTLSGAAATNAALAWLGGGALAAGGGGMAAGQALLALAGPIGWTFAGATLLTSIVLFANKRIKLNKEKESEIESVLNNKEQLEKTDAKLAALLQKTNDIREGLQRQYRDALVFFDRSFLEIPDEGKILLGSIVNNAKSLAASLSMKV